MCAIPIPSINLHIIVRFAFPPSPELIGNFDTLITLADQRDDDLIDGGTIDVKDSANNMMKVNEILSQYLSIYNSKNVKTSRNF